MQGFLDNFNSWWSVVSTLLNVLLFALSACLVVKSWLDSINEKRQVKIWMQYANGLNQALSKVVSDNLAGRYSTTNDMANAIWSLSSLSFGLYQSLYEERCISEKEFIEQQRKLRLEIEKAEFKVRQAQFKTALKSSGAQTGLVPPSPMTPPTPVNPPIAPTTPIPTQTSKSKGAPPRSKRKKP